MIVIADASAAAKLFLDEPGGEVVRTLWRSSGTWVAPTLILPEVSSAIASARRDGRLSTGEASEADARWASLVEEFALRVVDTELASVAGSLASSLVIRGADAVYVSVAHEVAEHTDVALASFDERQRGAALHTGIDVVPREL